MTTLSNQKSAVFWTSAFLVAVPSHSPAWVYAAILGIIALQSTLWYGAIALLFSTDTVRRFYQCITRYLDFLAGGAMVIIGLKLSDEVRREVLIRATP